MAELRGVTASDNSSENLADLLEQAAAAAAGRDLDAAEKLFRTALNMDPKDDRPSIVLQLASVLRARGDLEAAEEVLLPELEAAPQPERTHLLVTLSQLRFDRGDTSRAEALLRDALDRAPDEARTFVVVELSRLLSRQQRVDEALATLERFADEVPSDERGILLMEIARLRAGAGDVDGAEATFAQALEAATTHDLRPAVLIELARTRRERGELEGAMNALDRAMKGASEAARPAVLSELAEVLERQGKLASAEEALRTAVRDGPSDSRAFFLGRLGEVLGRHGNLEEAESRLREAVALTPADPGAWERLADVLERSGRLDEAAQLRRRAGSARPPGPAPTAPGDDPRPATATAAPDAQFDLVARAAGDLPAGEDLLGFAPLVRALHALLDDPKTTLPLAIAVTAPWGAGKSSVMRQLRGLLDGAPEAGGTGRRWKTVRFDAWKYERSERLWAALVKSVYDQAQERMSLRSKIAFRARLERRRLGWWKLAAVTLVPLLVVASAVSAALSADLSEHGKTVAGLSAAAIVLATASRYGAMIVNPFRRAIEKHAKRPDYEAQLGFTAEADREIRHLVSLLAPGPRDGIAIFVDDLDRCSSAHVVEVVEAMNQIFNAAEDHHCVFILGLDRDVVATNINVAYSATVAQLKEDGNPLGEQFGSEFLAKLVQLSVAIPQPDRAKIIDLMAAITGSTPVDDAVVPEEEDVQRAQQEIREKAADDTPASVESAAAEVAAGAIPAPVVAAAKHRERARRIKDSPAVVAAEFAALRFLEPNPRQVKRFHNAFRLQLYVASEDDRVTFDFSDDQLVALARWVALRLRWPGLADAIAREPELLAALEAAANDDLADAGTAELKQRHAGWLANRATIALVREQLPARRLSALRLDAFVRVV